MTMFVITVHQASGQIRRVQCKAGIAKLASKIISVLTKVEVKHVNNALQIHPQPRKDKRFAASVRMENT
jgi:hypothetical protein